MESEQEIKQGIAVIQQELATIKEILEQIKQKPDIHGRIDLANSTFDLNLTAWNRAIIELHLIKGELQRINP